MKRKGKTLSEEAADYLLEVVGDHLHDLENALEKVFLSVGEKRAIELADVEGIVSEVKISTIFDLMDAIGHQNLEKGTRNFGKSDGIKDHPIQKGRGILKEDGRSCSTSSEYDGKAISKHLEGEGDGFPASWSSRSCTGYWHVTMECEEIDGPREIFF